MSDPELPLAGGCMCGGVRFEVSEPLPGALYCHCKRCQRRTGTGVSVTALTAPGSYRTVSGADLIRSWDPGGGTPFAPPWAPVPDDGLPRFPERLTAGLTPPETSGGER